MFTFLVIVTSIVFIALLFVAAIRPAKSMTSVFELERRAGGGDDTAAAILRRDGALPDPLWDASAATDVARVRGTQLRHGPQRL